MKSRVLCLTLVLFAVVAVSPAAIAAPVHGRFLRNPADSSIVHSYGNLTPTTFDHDIFCHDIRVGGIKFDYDIYLHKPNGTDDGGAALSGGFYQDPGVAVRPGYKLAWVQTVTATLSGNNIWGVGNNVEFPDADSTATPAYPFTTTAATPPNPPGAPTLGYQDFPNRFFENGAQTWLAELGLVCIQDLPGIDGFREVHVISTFLWGFGVTEDPDTITANAPHALGAPTASYLATLNDFYDGTAPTGVATSKFRFSDDCDCFVATPEPTSMALLGLASIGGVGLRWRQRRKTAKDLHTLA